MEYKVAFGYRAHVRYQWTEGACHASSDIAEMPIRNVLLGPLKPNPKHITITYS